LAPHLAEQSLERDTILFEAGAPITHVYFPHHGVISLLIVSREGASIEAGTVGNEGVVGLGGLLAKDVSFTRQIVQLSGSASVISRRPFLEAVTASGTLRQRFSIQADRFTGQVLQSAACHALHSAEQRLARWLLETEDRWDDAELPVTQDLLATVLGVRRATISVAANTLQSIGVISYRRGRILIRERATLESMACECYAIIKELHESPFGCGDRG
jgi:CRP-like cAMP-binding protein